jgi:hypothetical protein
MQVIGQGSATGYRVPQWEQQEFFSNMGRPSIQEIFCIPATEKTCRLRSHAQILHVIQNAGLKYCR